MNTEESMYSGSETKPADEFQSMTYTLNLFHPGVIEHKEIYEFFPDGRATLQFVQWQGEREIVLEMTCHTSPKDIARLYSDILICTKQAAEIRMNACGSGNMLTITTSAGSDTYPSTLRSGACSIDMLCSQFISNTQLQNYLDACMYQI